MEEINIKTLLPVGEKLKPLLSKSCISESDLKGILAERGVFMGDNSKQMSIPLLTLSIISPKEFEKLQEFQKTKEDSVKFRTSKIESSTNENLNDIVPLSLIETQKIIDDSSNYTVNTDMQFTMNSENNLVLEYEILREDITKDWALSLYSTFMDVLGFSCTILCSYGNFPCSFFNLLCHSVNLFSRGGSFL